MSSDPSADASAARALRLAAAPWPPVSGLARDQFAYLRACISGVPHAEAAQRYLGMAPGPGLRAFHRQLLDQLQALARQRGDARWALLGVSPRRRASGAGESPGVMPAKASSFEDWVAAHGWEDWSQAEQLEAYETHLLEQAAGAPAPAAPRIDFLSRAEQRLHRLQQRQLALLQDLERPHHASAPAPRARAHDPVSAWFDPATAGRLHAAGLATLGQLQRTVRHSAQWHRPIKAIGEGKARRIEALLARCLPAEGPTADGLAVAWQQRLHTPAFDGSNGRFRAERPRIAARTDAAAIEAWLDAAVPAVPATRAAYRREVERWWLWCVVERGRPLSSCDAVDARAYLDFLAAVPERWQSRRMVERWTAGWTPFRGSLGPQSRRFAFQVLHQLGAWLAGPAGYLAHNPWAAVERGRPAAGERPLPPEERVLPGPALAALQAALPDPARPGATRNGLLLLLCSRTGLRASELLAATVGQLHGVNGRWTLAAGCTGRNVSLPAVAVEALEQSLLARGLGPLATCAADVPLLPSARDPRGRPSYGALHRSFRGFVVGVLRRPAAPIPVAARALLARTTQQWLRHTFAHRAAAAGMPVDLLRHHLGHADSRRVRRYYPVDRASSPITIG